MNGERKPARADGRAPQAEAAGAPMKAQPAAFAVPAREDGGLDLSIEAIDLAKAQEGLAGTARPMTAYER